MGVGRRRANNIAAETLETPLPPPLLFGYYPTTRDPCLLLPQQYTRVKTDQHHQGVQHHTPRLPWMTPPPHPHHHYTHTHTAAATAPSRDFNKCF